MNTLPLFFKLENQAVLIVGGGEVALRKATLLARAGAHITFIAKRYQTSLQDAFGDQPQHTLHTGTYDSALLTGKTLVIACTDDTSLNEQIYRDCQARHIPVNVVDNPPLCTFIFPAIVDRDPITVAVSSAGKAPVLARLLRAKIETVIPPQYGALAGLAGKFRDHAKAALPNITARRKFWEQVFEGTIAEHVFANDVPAAERDLQDLLATHREQLTSEAAQNSALGKVYIVGAGAGDPDLLTFKALRLMQQADIVFYDNLVSAPILDLCRRDATKIYVGKKASNHAVSQDQINELLIRHAKQGKRVLRLKGGDPFVFGRGGEEAERLAAAGVAYEIVPGITSATAAASYAGIPLTHRDYAQSVQFVTACIKTNTINNQFSQLLDDNQTLVFYMGLNQLAAIADGLVGAGRAPDTPIAIVSNASLPNQRVLTGTLADIVAKQADAQLPTPALLIVGNVVKLHDTLAWFGPKDANDDDPSS